MLALDFRVAQSGLFPRLFARLAVECQNRGLVGAGVAVSVNELAINSIAVENRRGTHAVADAELAVLLLQVKAPDRRAVEVEAGQVPAAHQAPNVSSIRHWGG